MPTIELTEPPKELLSPNARLAWWKVQILAYLVLPDCRRDAPPN